jgi:hypothetical protein
MRNEGFEYVVREPEVAMGTAVTEQYDLPAGEYAERYGYGITTIDIDEEVQEAADLDPNEAIIDGLSEEARYAYFVARYGAEAAATKFGEVAPADTEPGCEEQANQAVFGSTEKEPLPDEFNLLREEMDALADRIDRDPRVKAARQAWADCLADAGYAGFAGPGEPEIEIRKRQWELYGLELPEGSLDPDTGPTRSEDKADIPLPAPRGGVEPDPAALKELQDYEVAVAVADLGCRPAFDEAESEVQFEVEAAFVDANRAELERFRDAISSGGGG